jgi:hypothetical protein
MQLVIGHMELLGAMVGGDHTAIRRELTANTNRNHAPFFELLPRLTRQSALHLLRVCGVPRFNYLARAQSPEDLRPAAEAFDQNVAQALAHLLGTKATSSRAFAVAADQAALPIRLSGLGLRRCTEVSPAAFYACALLAFRRNPAVAKHRTEYERRRALLPPAAAAAADRPDPIWAESIERAGANITAKVDDDQRQPSARINSVLFTTFAEFDRAVSVVPLSFSESQSDDSKLKQTAESMQCAQRIITVALEEKAAPAPDN